jgi:nucleotide-binding universal stress UspA family protein
VVDWLTEDEHVARDQIVELRRLIAEDARNRLRQSIPEDAREWCEIEERVTCGKPYREIVRAANDSAAELVVMGVHGRGAVDLMLFGSTTQHVVREAACPVLTIRNGREHAPRRREEEVR